MASPTEGLLVDPFDFYDDRWPLVTAGTIDDFNSMTIAWGMLGSIWSEPTKRRSLVTIYVKPIRHTFG